MSDLPERVHILEEGPREGFQYEKGPIATERKIELIEALSHTGLDHIQIVSFVSPKAVPGMSDADDVVRQTKMNPQVDYTALWVNQRGFERAVATKRLRLMGSVTLSASEKFLKRNQNKTGAEQAAAQRAMIDVYRAEGVPVERAFLMAAFGCNFQGDIPLAEVCRLAREALDIAEAGGAKIKRLYLGDTMGWATPLAVKRAVGALRERHPDVDIGLHLHDTRGMGIANAYAGLEMGVTHFDSSVAGLGGCPFAGNRAAAGNVCTEDLVFLCEEIGIETGVDLGALIECARLAEDIVGHPLPGSVKTGGSLREIRARIG